MSVVYATGKHAFGYCDRCAFRWPLHELKEEIVNFTRSGLLVCPDCFDPDHPQYRLSRLRVDDPQALRNPRPEIDIERSRNFTGWQPVGFNTSSSMDLAVGQVTVTVVDPEPTPPPDTGYGQLDFQYPANAVYFFTFF